MSAFQSVKHAAGLAFNLHALRVHIKTPNPEAANRLARRMTKSDVCAAGSSQFWRDWHTSNLRRDVARFANNAPCGEIQDEVICAGLLDIHKKNADLKIRLIERLFDRADAIYVAVRRNLPAILEASSEHQRVRLWVLRQLEFIRKIEEQMTAGIDDAEYDIFVRYRSSYWQALCNARSAMSYFDEQDFPIPQDNQMVVIVNNDTPVKWRDIPDTDKEFSVHNAREEFVSSLFNTFLFGAKQLEWRDGKLFIRQTRGPLEINSLSNSFTGMAWPPKRDDMRFLSYQRVSGWKINITDLGSDDVEIIIDFGKGLRLKVQ